MNQSRPHPSQKRFPVNFFSVQPRPLLYESQAGMVGLGDELMMRVVLLS